MESVASLHCTGSLSIRYKSVPFPSRLHCTGSLLFDLIQKCSFSLAFRLYQYSFGAVQVQNCSSFLAGTKLYLIAGTKLYRITLSSVNAWLIRNTFVSDQTMIWYSVNAALIYFTGTTAMIPWRRKSCVNLKAFKE